MAYHGFKPAEQAIQIGDDEILSSHISDGVIVNADVNNSAAIATSKVSGAVTSIGSHGLGSLATLSAVASAQITDGTIVNADVNNSAAIATSKLSGSLTSVTSHGLATSATTDTTNASNISSGTLAAARVATLNQNTTGQAGTVATITGLAPDTATTQATQASITSAANLSTVGTITSGVWNSSTKIASAYLDDDTAHLSTTQTFSGAKTFSADMALTTGSNPTFTVTEGSVAGGMRTKGAGLFVGTTSEHSLYLTTGGLADADKALTIDTSQNATFAGTITANNGYVYYGTGGEYIYSDNTHLYAVSTNDLKLNSVGNTSIDAEGDIILDANGADVVLKDDGTQYGALTNTSGNLIIKSGSTTMLTGSGANATFAGNVTLASTKKLYLDGGGNSYISEIAGDDIDIVAGGTASIQIRGADTTFAGDITVSQNSGNTALYNTGGGHGVLATGSGKDLNIASDSGTIYLNDNATFSGNINSGAITSTGAVIGTSFKSQTASHSGDGSATISNLAGHGLMFCRNTSGNNAYYYTYAFFKSSGNSPVGLVLISANPAGVSTGYSVSFATGTYGQNYIEASHTQGDLTMYVLNIG